MDTNVQLTEQDVLEVLGNSAMLVLFVSKTWSATTTDKKATGMVKDQAGAKGDIGDFRKKLLANNSARYDALKAAINGAYHEHLKMTSPFGQSSYRMLPNARFEKYIERMQWHLNNVAAKRTAFVADYPDMIQKAVPDLGSLADMSKYPTAAEVGDRFGINFEFEPLGNKPFAGLPPNFAGALNAMRVKRLQEQAKEAIADTWKRAKETLSTYHNQMREGGKIFDATVETVIDMPARLRAFNVVQDAQIEAVATLVEQKLAIYDRKALENENIRKWCHQASGEILELIPDA